MFHKLLEEAKTESAAIKARLAELYVKLRNGDLTPEQRSRLETTVRALQGKIDAQTKKLSGDGPGNGS